MTLLKSAVFHQQIIQHMVIGLVTQVKNPCNLGIKQLSVVLRGCYLPIGVKMMNALGFLVPAQRTTGSFV